MSEIFTQQRVTVSSSQGELSIEYLTAGEGTPLLLLHGVGDSAYSWQWIIPILASNHRIYAPSLPGFGMSTKGLAEYSPEFFASFITAFLDTLGLEKVSIVGNSLGGLVALRFALAAPKRVAALTLIDSAGLGREISLAMRLLTLPGMGKITATLYRTSIGARLWSLAMAMLLFANPTKVPRVWLERLNQMARDPNYLEATVATVKSGNTLAGQKEHEILLDQLSRLTMPTLVIWGESDRLVPSRQAQAASTRLAQGKVVVLPNCGHVPQLEQPERVGEILSEFLRDAVVLTQS